jgi:hypothetical protein
MSHPRRHHFARGRAVEMALCDSEPVAAEWCHRRRRSAHLDMRSSEPTMLTARASYCCKPVRA